MAPQRIFLIVGGPLNGHAFRPQGTVLSRFQVVELEDNHYIVTLVPRPKYALSVPELILMHHTVPKGELIWRTFLGTYRAWAAEVLR